MKSLISRKSVHCLLVVMFAAGTSVAQTGAAGKSGLSFLKLGIGARANGLGHAYSAVADDAEAVYWNPAGLMRLQKRQVTVTHTEWLQGISNDFAAFAFKGMGGAVGLSAYLNQVDGIERRTRPSDQPIGTVEANDLALGLSYARRFSSKLNAGVTFKYLYEKISLESANGYAFDFGFSFRPGTAPMYLALVIQNLGSMSELLNDSVSLPSTVRLGASYLIGLGHSDLLLAGDLVKISDLDMRANFGTELKFKKHFALRLGYQTGNEVHGLSAGFGLLLKSVHLDYGYTPFSSDLGNTHRFSFALDF